MCIQYSILRFGLGFLLLISLTHCQVSWYTKEGTVRKQIYPDPDEMPIPALGKADKVCLITSMSFRLPMDRQTQQTFDPLINTSPGKDSHTTLPNFEGMDPEFLNYLKAKLDKSNKIKVKHLLYRVPDSWRNSNALSVLNSPKSLERYNRIAEIGKTNPALAETLNAYASVIDHNTYVTFSSESLYDRDIPGCDTHVYFFDHRYEGDRYNALLFLITLGIVPGITYENHIYQILIRRTGTSEREVASYKFGYRKMLSWIFLPTFGVFNSVSDFNTKNPFSEISEDFFLDSLAESFDKNL